MLNALKRLDKKFLVIIGFIIFLPILLIIFLAIFQGCRNTKITHEQYKDKMISAAERYVDKLDKLKLNESETLTISLDDLVEGEYIKSTEKLLSDNTCEGSVIVRRNGSTVEENEGGFLNYIAMLKCDKYETKTLKNELMKELTTTGSGLYEVNGSYVFKGDEVNNYINFFGNEYRIINIDSNGLLKLVKVNEEAINKYWDIKYNTEVNATYGKNIYKDSNILKTLVEDYLNPKKISKSAKTHIVSKDICIDSRDINDLSINNSECANILKNQVISLMGVTDFANASNDSECTNIKAKSCRNYNYLHTLRLNTWTYTAVSNNTYEVYYLQNGIIDNQQANKYLSYNLVIYIDGNESMFVGEGTKSNPYVIE